MSKSFKGLGDAIKKFVDGTSERDDYDDDSAVADTEDYYAEEEPAPAPKPKAREKSKKVIDFSRRAAEPIDTIAESSQLVLRKIKGPGEVKPAGEMLKAGHVVIINLEECSPEYYQRIVDILSGICFAIDGDLRPIDDKVLVATPRQVSISTGDYTELMEGSEE